MCNKALWLKLEKKEGLDPRLDKVREEIKELTVELEKEVIVRKLLIDETTDVTMMIENLEALIGKKILIEDSCDCLVEWLDELSNEVLLYKCDLLKKVTPDMKLAISKVKRGLKDLQKEHEIRKAVYCRYLGKMEKLRVYVYRPHANVNMKS